MDESGLPIFALPDVKEITTAISEGRWCGVHALVTAGKASGTLTYEKCLFLLEDILTKQLLVNFRGMYGREEEEYERPGAHKPHAYGRPHQAVEMLMDMPHDVVSRAVGGAVRDVSDTLGAVQDDEDVKAICRSIALIRRSPESTPECREFGDGLLELMVRCPKFDPVVMLEEIQTESITPRTKSFPQGNRVYRHLEAILGVSPPSPSSLLPPQ